MIKVLIADDHPIVRQGLRQILAGISDMKVAGEAVNAQETLDQVRAGGWNVLVLDITMPGGSGIEVLENIKQAGTGPMVIILTNYPYPVYRQKCMQAGADFFLDKSSEFDQIPELFEWFKADKSQSG